MISLLLNAVQIFLLEYIFSQIPEGFAHVTLILVCKSPVY